MKILNPVIKRYKHAIREKAIKQAKTRIVLAGKKPEDFSVEDLEVIVKEEEDNIISQFKEKGVIAALAFLGIGWFG